MWLVQGDPGTPEILRHKLVALVAWPLLRATSLRASAWIDNWLKWDDLTAERLKGKKFHVFRIEGLDPRSMGL